MPIFHVDAVEIEQNGQIFYSTAISSKILEQTCFVSRREEDAKKGFQRLLNPARAKSIAEYLDNKKGAIPTALILSAQPNSELHFEKKLNKISFNAVKKSFLVLDGQHRLFGFIESKNTFEVPVIIFSNLNSANEVKYFIDINTTQKGVSSSLILDIRNLAGIETKIEEKLRNIFDLINKDLRSPLIGLMSSSKSEAGKISRVAFNGVIKPLVESPLLKDTDVDMIAKILINYLRASEKILISSKATYAKLNKYLFFSAFFNLFEYVAEKTIAKSNNLKEETFYAVMEPLVDIAYDIHKGSSKVTISNLVKAMKESLSDSSKSITKDMV